MHSFFALLSRRCASTASTASESACGCAEQSMRVRCFPGVSTSNLRTATPITLVAALTRVRFLFCLFRVIVRALCPLRGPWMEHRPPAFPSACPLPAVCQLAGGPSATHHLPDPWKRRCSLQSWRGVAWPRLPVSLREGLHPLPPRGGVGRDRAWRRRASQQKR